MRDRLLTYIPVTLIAVLIWLFAEAESLGTYSDETTQVRFVANDEPDRVILAADGVRSSVRISLDFRAPQSAIGGIRAALSRGIELRPGSASVPSGHGKHDIDLAQALRSSRDLAGQGIDIMSVRPQTIQIEIIDYETRLVPVLERLSGVDGVDTEGSVSIAPTEVQIRLPISVWSTLDPNIAVFAIPTQEDLDGMPSSGPVRLEMGVTLPDELASLPNPPSPSQRITLAFTLRNRNRSFDFDVVPVHVLLPSIEVGKWNVRIDPDDEVVSLRAEGPSAEIVLMETSNRAMIGILSLTSEELEQGIVSKAIWFSHREGVSKVEIPQSVTITPSKDVVRFEITRRTP